MLMALFDALIQLNAIIPNVKFMIFIRENMFDRVRSADREISRIETAVVFPRMDSGAAKRTC